jgi:hypothetical protein
MAGGDPLHTALFRLTTADARPGVLISTLEDGYLTIWRRDSDPMVASGTFQITQAIPVVRVGFGEPRTLQWTGARSDQRWHRLGATRRSVVPAAGPTRESGVPDRQTENPRDISITTAREIIQGRTPENLHCQLWRRSYCWGGSTWPWPAKPGPFLHNRLTLKT